MTIRFSQRLFLALATMVITGSALGEEQTPETGTPPKGGGEVTREGTGQTIGLPPGTEAPVEPGAAPVRKTQPAQRTPEREAPYQAGSFLLYPELSGALMYDSNVFATNDVRVSDWAAIWSPAVWLQSNWDRHALNFYGAADLTYYQEEDSENTQDWRLSTEGRYDVTPDANAYGGVWWSRDHEDRESPDGRNGLFPTIYYTFAGYAGYFQQFHEYSVRLGGRAEHLTFQNVQTASPGFPVIINDDRDRWRYTGGGRFGYEFTPRWEGFVQLAVDNRRYDRKPDDFVFAGGGAFRDSDGERAYVGARFNVPRVIKAEAYAGYMSQDYEDARLADVNEPGFGANVLWNATDTTRVSFYLDRTIEETTVFQSGFVASSYVNTFGGVTVSYRPLDRLTLYGNLFASRAAYQGIVRTDDYTGGALGAAYRVNKHFLWDLAYSYRQLDSSAPQIVVAGPLRALPGEDFQRSQVFLRAVFSFSE